MNKIFLPDLPHTDFKYQVYSTKKLYLALFKYVKAMTSKISVPKKAVSPVKIAAKVC